MKKAKKTDARKAQQKAEGKWITDEDEMTPKQRLKAIWMAEGVDAALSCSKSLGISQKDMLRQIIKWM